MTTRIVLCLNVRMRKKKKKKKKKKKSKGEYLQNTTHLTINVPTRDIRNNKEIVKTAMSAKLPW